MQAYLEPFPEDNTKTNIQKLQLQIFLFHFNTLSDPGVTTPISVSWNFNSFWFQVTKSKKFLCTLNWQLVRTTLSIPFYWSMGEIVFTVKLFYIVHSQLYPYSFFTKLRKPLVIVVFIFYCLIIVLGLYPKCRPLICTYF